MSKRLEGKVAIITGSTSGIGRATATLFAEHGARVVVQGRRAELGQQVVDGIVAAGGEAFYLQGDVANVEHLKELVARTVETYGRLDILMNNAWSGKNRKLTDTEVADWDESFAVTLRAPALTSKYAIPEMIKNGGGSIINVSSVHGMLASRAYLPYDAMKAGLVNLTRQMAVDYGPHGIRVNAVCPGFIVIERSAAYAGRSPEIEAFHRMIYPLGRPGAMIEVAYAALFLASDEASFVTGAALMVDGGLTCQLQDSVGGAAYWGMQRWHEQNQPENQ